MQASMGRLGQLLAALLCLTIAVPVATTTAAIASWSPEGPIPAVLMLPEILILEIKIPLLP
jgi:hypothetical protein